VLAPMPSASVTTATAVKGRAAVLTPDMLEPGMHINAIGGDCPGKTELHPDVLAASRVFVEFPPQTRIEGEIQQMPADFAVTELWDVLAGNAAGRVSQTDITVFDSVGFAIEDFSALRFVRDLTETGGDLDSQLLYDAGRLALDDLVAQWLPDWRGSDRGEVTVRQLLTHSSGLTAYLPLYRDCTGRFEFEKAICTLPLEYAPGTQSIYSDLGFMLLGFILDDLGSPLDEIFRLKAEATYPIFNPPREWRERTAPTELDLWRGRLLQGEVHDENTWALGGLAGHAGLFGTARGVGGFAQRVLDGSLARPHTFARFVQKSSVPGSSRALAWDTMLPTSSCGTLMSPRAIGHTGFTGTSLWIDPAQDLYVVLLTNRVHPTRENNAIQPVRRAVHDAVVRSLPAANSR